MNPRTETFPIRSLTIPPLLNEIADPPKKLTMRGVFPEGDLKFLAVVGSRKYTPYGKQMCEKLISGLKGCQIVIVSGLALGIDGIAHRAAIHASLPTVAIPGSGLDDSVLYPSTHRPLAREILLAGGALVSEFDPLWRPRPESFPQRNRIMAGLSHAVLVIEAEQRSGTLITSRLASEYNRDVLAVPGRIDSINSAGPHMLIQKGASLITSSKDICSALNITSESTEKNQRPSTLTTMETKIWELLKAQPLPRDELFRALNVPVSEFNVLLASLELRGLLTERMGAVEWR